LSSDGSISASVGVDMCISHWFVPRAVVLLILWSELRTCGLLVFNCWSTSSIVDCSIDSTISYSFNILPCFVIGNICGFTIYSTNKHWSC